MTTPKRRGPSPIPWESVASLRAGLPRERDAWLALVLPHVDASTSHVEAAAAITAAGFPVARFQVCAWHAWLDAARLRGELPEHPQPLPSRQAGRVPSVEARAAGGRTTAARRRAKKA